MTDTHSHLNDPRFAEDLEEVVKRAVEWGVKRINVVGYDLPSSRRAVEIAEQFPEVWAVVGLHPYEAERYGEEDLKGIEDLLSHPKVVAVGEIGLDYYRGPEDREAQRRLFLKQIALARSHDLPVVLHVRDAFEDVVAVISDFPDVAFVFHSFSGDEGDMERVIPQRNWYVSFSGMLTFLAHVRRAAALAPRDRTFVETDAPYLAPVPKRGRRNEPAYVKFTLERLAEVWGVEYGEAERITDGNAERFFGYGKREIVSP